MTILRLKRRTLTLLVTSLLLLTLFVYVAVRSGPLAPVAVTVMSAASQPIAPALFGIGTVEARHIYKIGPTGAGRIQRLDVDVGDTVSAGQVLGEMEAVDLDERIRAQQAAIKSATATAHQAEAKQVFAQTQATRYARLLAVRGISEESVAAKQQELAIANAALAAVREDIPRLHAELEALRAQRNNLRLVTPVAGLVVARAADPGTTMLAGQAVIEIIDPAKLWVATRFDQISAGGLSTGLPAQITLRSQQNQKLAGRVLRIEPRADAVTEETLAKIVFDAPTVPQPPLGELAEITVQLAELPAAPTIPNAALRTVNGKRGVWKLVEGKLVFAALTLGRSDLAGRVQVLGGLAAGERIAVYSEKALTANSRIYIVERLAGVAP